MHDGRLVADESGAQVAAYGSVVAPGFSRANTNEAFDAANADLDAGRAGTNVRAGEAAIRTEAVRTVERDPLLEQMMAEEREREARENELRAQGMEVHHAVRDAGGLKGAGGSQGARDARKLEKLRDRKER